MTGITYRIELDDAGLGRALDALISAAGDLRPAMEDIGAYMEASTVQRFEDQRAPDGQPWLPSIRAREEGGLTLVDKGHLRGSITHLAGAREVEVGSNLVYAAIHQLGGQAGRGHRVTLPAREYLGVSDDDEVEIHTILADFLREAMK